MKVFLLSDVHFEFYHQGWMPELPAPGECDVIILAGDIHVGSGFILALEKVWKATGAHVVAVAGNHEFYGKHIDKYIKKYQDIFRDHPQIHFLENDSVEINGVNFIGATLWTDFNSMGKDKVRHAMYDAKDMIADFHKIKIDSYRKFTPMDAAVKYRESRQYISKAAKESSCEKNVVVTHFPPSRVVRHKNIAEDLLTAYFQANCHDLVLHLQPDLWCYGHNHWSDDVIIGETQVVSNQPGYPGEAGLIPGQNMKIIGI